MMPVRLEPGASQSQVKHSITELPYVAVVIGTLGVNTNADFEILNTCWNSR